MQTRIGRLGGILAAGTALALAVCTAPAQAAPPTENSLLGIRLLDPFSKVLAKYGQPTEIQPGAPVAPASPGGGSQAAGGGRMGMMSGGPMGAGGGPPASMRQYMSGMSGAPMGAGGGPPASMRQYMSGMSGAPMGAGGGPPASMRQYMGGMGGYGGAMAARGGGGLPGFAASGAPSGGGLPGFSSGGTDMFGGIGSGGVTTDNAEDATPNETTWWYHDVKHGLHVSFLFNKEGKVIQIQQYGWNGGGKTRRGVGLGSSLGTVIKAYGWTNNGAPSGEDLLFRYGSRDQVAFQLVKNKVVGITVGRVK